MTSTARTALVGNSAPEIPADEKDHSERRCTFLIEPAVMFLVFGLNLSGTILSNQIIYQTCTSVFMHNASVCSLLGTANSTPESQRIETQVQPYAADIFMTKIILESVVPAIGGLFFGPWSDKHGRKPLLVASFTGFSCIYIITALICSLSKSILINPWYYILAVIPECLLGGNCAYGIATFCYVADITTAEQRPIRMAFLEASIYIGLMAGSFASSYIYAATSAFTVFTISASVVVLTTLYVIFCVPESLHQRGRLSSVEAPRQPPSHNLVQEMLETCFKPRPNRVRLMVWLIIFIQCASVFIINGSSTVFYLFVREKFQWTVRDYTLYETFGTLVPILGNIAGMLIMRKMFNVSVTTLALLAIGSSTLNALVKGLASVPWHIYLAVGVGVFKAVSSPMCKAIVSNLVPATDLGKIFAFLNVLESFVPFIATALYTFVYGQTITTYPGAFNFISTGLYLISFVFVSIIFYVKHSRRELYGMLL